MKEDSQLNKNISVLLIFLLLVQMSGCTSTRIISKSDLPRPDPGKYAYIVHSEKIKFLLEKSTISNDTLSGKIRQTYLDNAYDGWNKIHLYFSSDSVIKIDNKGEFLCVPVNEAIKVQMVEPKSIGTVLIVAYTLIILIAGINVAILLSKIPHTV